MDAAGRRIDEETHADAKCFQLFNDVGHSVGSGARLPTGLARDFPRYHRNERALVRTHFAHQLQQVRPRVAFNVVFDMGRAAV